MSDIYWRNRAACLDEDPELFFPGPSETGLEAKAVCARCPVMLTCRAKALERRESAGVWGGMTELDRENRIRRDQRKAKAAEAVAEGEAAAEGGPDAVPFEARWEITELGMDMTLSELTAEARKGRLAEAARAQGVTVKANTLHWRIDSDAGQVVATGTARRARRAPMPEVCRGCQRRLRNGRLEDHPGTIRHHARGLCQSCHGKEQRGADIPPAHPERANRRAVAA